jgi:hypothetical protein
MLKTKGVKPNAKAANFMGRGVNSPDAGITPYDTAPMGTYYGTGIKNPQGKMRNDSIGYRPVSRKQLGTPPKSVV